MNPDDKSHVWISPQEAARLLGVSDMTIRRHIASKQLIGRRVGPKLLQVRRDSLERMIEAA